MRLWHSFPLITFCCGSFPFLHFAAVHGLDSKVAPRTTRGLWSCGIPWITGHGPHVFFLFHRNGYLGDKQSLAGPELGRWESTLIPIVIFRYALGFRGSFASSKASWLAYGLEAWESGTSWESLV